MANQFDRIIVFWDTSHPEDEHWMCCSKENHAGAWDITVPVGASLDEAIKQACCEIDADLAPHQFIINGREARWEAETNA